ncbi:MAG: PD40 domain-containing protein [Bacteroidales bacterium]|nr:PD40 domain-containing protein [Bacteroidales bacterium]MBN2632873.1 PD40 domain-containing protein [Bacteroidales bacterium]
MMNNFGGKNFRHLVQIAVFMVFTLNASGQSAREMKEIFAQAESYYLYEEYELANQLYILLENPENLNLSYKIGTCYLNIPDEKEKAIPYLEAAVKNAAYDAKTGSFKEKRAPLDAWFYLARAYMINNDFEKALGTFKTFQNLAAETGKKGMQNLDFVNQQIEACNNAIMLVENPVPVSKKLLGEGFTLGAMNENPAVSFDGNTIVYTERRGLVNVILFSRRIRGKWQNPVEITGQLNAGEDCSACALNHDGTELYLYKTDMFDGNIYISKYINDQWTPITRLNKNINTKFYESHASVSADGKRLFFTSNRDEGEGGLDIYMSEKDAEGEWGPAVNLGPTVNTPYNEEHPFITADDSLLYFSSEGHTNMGGYDNFRSRKTSEGWGKPENLGYPINTTDDDKFFKPLNNGKNAFYSMKTDYKKRDIFYLGLDGTDVNNTWEIIGSFGLNDAPLTEGSDYSVKVVDLATGETAGMTSPLISTGYYSVTVPPGKMQVIWSAGGYFTKTADTLLAEESTEMIITLDAVLERDSSLIAVYEKINLEEIPFVEAIDSSILIKDMVVSNLDDVIDSDILYYTVQVMALYNPVDISYFKHIDDMKVMYNENDRFYRYTSGRFATREEAEALLRELKRKGYPDDIFVKKVSR